MGKKARLKCVEGVSTVSIDYSFRKLKWKMRDKAMKWEDANGPEEPERQKASAQVPRTSSVHVPKGRMVKVFLLTLFKNH